MKGHETPAHTAAWSLDGRTLVSLSNDGAVLVWNAESGEKLRDLTQAERVRASTLALSQDGALVAIPWKEGAARIWNVETGAHLRDLPGHPGGIRALAFTKDRRLVTAGADGTVKTWDPASGEVVLAFGAEPPSPIVAVAVSRDGSRIAIACEDRSIRIHATDTGRRIAATSGHDSSVQALAFSPDGARLASASADQTVRLWDPRTGDSVLTLPHDAAVWSVAFSTDGSRLLAIPLDSTVVIRTARASGTPTR
jgi:WD40 repeat protein